MSTDEPLTEEQQRVADDYLKLAHRLDLAYRNLIASQRALADAHEALVNDLDGHLTNVTFHAARARSYLGRADYNEALGAKEMAYDALRHRLDGYAIALACFPARLAAWREVFP